MRGINTRVHLAIKTSIYNAVMAEAKLIGFSASDIVNKVLYDAGYGKPARLGKEPPPEKPYPPPQWDDENDHQYRERQRVEDRLVTGEHSTAHVLRQYRAHGFDAIIYSREPGKPFTR